MKVTFIAVTPIVGNYKRLRAYANIELDNQLRIYGIKIFQKDNEEYYLEFPRNEESRNNRLTNIRPSKELRQYITGEVLFEYYKTLKT